MENNIIKVRVWVEQVVAAIEEVGVVVVEYLVCLCLFPTNLSKFG